MKDGNFVFSGLKKLMKEDTTFWDTFLIAFGELIGTAILVFIGCTGCVGSLGTVPSILQVSFVFGFAVMIAIQVRNYLPRQIKFSEALQRYSLYFLDAYDSVVLYDIITALIFFV